MGVNEKPVMFESHGKTFPTKEEAERWDELKNAEEAFATAKRALEAAVARTWRTKDGDLLEFGILHEYFRISRVWGHPPVLQTVKGPYWYDFTIQHDRDPVIRFPGGPRREYEEYDVRELYAHEHNARVALIEALDDWLLETKRHHAEALERLRKERR